MLDTKFEIDFLSLKIYIIYHEFSLKLNVLDKKSMILQLLYFSKNKKAKKFVQLKIFILAFLVLLFCHILDFPFYLI